MPDVMQGNPKRVDTIVINDEVETPSLLNPMSGQIFVTNRVGKRIMELSDGSRGVDLIAEEITRDFKGSKTAVVLEEAWAFLRESTRKGLITWEQ